MVPLHDYAATEGAGFTGWKVLWCCGLSVSGWHLTTTTAFQPDHWKVDLEDMLQMNCVQLLRMGIRLENCHKGLESALGRTLSQRVSRAPGSVQLPYFQNRAIKSISKFPLWSSMELKILWGLSRRKSQNEAKLLDFTWFISSRGSQLPPGSGSSFPCITFIFFFFFLSRSLALPSPYRKFSKIPAIHFESLKAFWFYLSLYFTYINSYFIWNSQQLTTVLYRFENELPSISKLWLSEKILDLFLLYIRIYVRFIFSYFF